MFKSLAAAIVTIALTGPAVARVEPFPATFHAQNVQTNGTTLYVRVGGRGPAVVLLHGFGDSGDMWAPLASILAKDHTVIVPDLRGMGLSAHPDTGYTKANQAVDIAGVMDALDVQHADLVTHDIGNMVGYATTPSSSSALSTRMPSTTRQCSPKMASSPCRYSPWEPRNPLGPDKRTSYGSLRAMSPVVSCPAPVIGSWKRTPKVPSSWSRTSSFIRLDRRTRGALSH